MPVVEGVLARVRARIPRVLPKPEYRQVGTHRGWGVWRKNGLADFVGNMRLEMSVKGVDEPDLKADIDEHMRSSLAAFERSIRPGSKPAGSSRATRRRIAMQKRSEARRAARRGSRH